MKQKLKALASLCLALALTLCLTLPAWAAGGDDAAGRSIASNATGSIKVSDVESGVTVNVYQLMTVNVNDTAHQPQMPVYSWVKPVGDWLKKNTDETYKGYISNVENDYSVTENFKDDGEKNAAEIAAFYDSLAAAIRGGTAIPNFQPTGKATVAQNQTECTISGLSMGNYLVLIEGGMKIYRPSAVNLVPEWKPGTGDNPGEWVLNDASVKLKSSSLGITKTVVDGVYTQETNIDQPDGKKYARVAIGDTVTYILEADVPQYPASATATGYYISDKLPAGMTVDQIQVYGVDANNECSPLSSSDTKNDDPDYISTLTPPTNGTIQRPTGEGNDKNVDFLLSFVYDKIKDYSKIRVVYTAKVNENIQVVGDNGNTTGNENTAYLDYNNNPYETSAATWETDSDTATVYTYGIKVTKTDDKDTTKVLTGAQFELYKANESGEIAEGAQPISFVESESGAGTYRKATQAEIDTTAGNITKTTLTVGNEESNNKGKLTLSGLDVGTYILKETKAPDEYNLPSHTFSVKITDGTNAEPVTDPDGLVDTDKSSAQDGYNEITITNTTGFTLPTTGGMGTVLFTAGGVVLMGAGLVLLVVFLRRRRAK